jgi:hypothetical protein
MSDWRYVLIRQPTSTLVNIDPELQRFDLETDAKLLEQMENLS